MTGSARERATPAVVSALVVTGDVAHADQHRLRSREAVMAVGARYAELCSRQAAAYGRESAA